MAENIIAVPEEIVDFKPGTRIWFGNEKTQWRVLEVDREEETALLIAEEAVCSRKYHDTYSSITWEKCTLRKWLNGEYYEKTFSDAEKEAITESELQNPDNPKYNTKGGNDTKDKIFLLSIEEAKKYFKNDKDRATGSWWWLRSPGLYCSYAAYVYFNGGIRYDGFSVSNDYGVRPAFKINLKSELFQSLICDSKSKNLKIRKPELYIREGKLITGKKTEGTFEIPEGVTELGEGCFADWRKLEEVKLPATLKKIGKEAFEGCAGLRTITGMNGAISYGKDVFAGCKNLIYTAEMFRNAGKLCDSFAEHFDACGAEELAWLLMYQKGPVWEKNLHQKINKENAPEILKKMAEHIAGIKAAKKQGTAAVEFVTKNVLLLTREAVNRLCDVLREKKLSELADSLLTDPAVAALTSAREEKEKPEERVLEDGSILYGRVEEKVEVGSYFPMGRDGGLWRILDIDGDEALVIAEKEICNRKYHDTYSNITWEQCDLRKWLNGEYYEAAFSDEERKAIIECELQNPDNPQYGTKDGNATKDKIFLLSIEEAEKYFANNGDRATGSWWWLRSPGYNSCGAAYVLNLGSIYNRGYSVSNDLGVRPAFKINLKSDFFQSLISENQNGEAVFKNRDQHQVIIKAGEVISTYRNVTEVSLPPYVKKIAAGAFANCMKLTKLSWQGKQPVIDKDAFSNCPNLQLPTELYNGTKLPHKNFAPYLPAEPEIMANTFLIDNADSAFTEAAVDRITAENAAAMTDAVLNRGQAIHPGILSRYILAVMPAINKERTDALYRPG